MNDNDAIGAYIDAASKLQQLPLSPEQRARAIQTLTMTAQIVAPLMAFELPPETEAAPVFEAGRL
jgi:hypothetical protein